MPKTNTRKRQTASRTSRRPIRPAAPAAKRLATNPREWADLSALVRDHVERICGRYDDREQAESSCLLLDLITNERYDRCDRECVLHTAETHGFTFTDAFRTAQDICFNKLPQGTELRMVM